MCVDFVGLFVGGLFVVGFFCRGRFFMVCYLCSLLCWEVGGCVGVYFEEVLMDLVLF